MAFIPRFASWGLDTLSACVCVGGYLDMNGFDITEYYNGRKAGLFMTFLLYSLLDIAASYIGVEIL